MADLPPHRHVRDRARRTARAALSLLSAAALALSLTTLAGVGESTPLASPVAAAAEGRPPLSEPGIPVRIRVPDLGIDLPVVSSELKVAGNTRDYPLCDVAQYWTIYDLPGAPGTTWVYAHAQPGMFLPLFLTADATGGAGLIGKIVTLQLRDGRFLRYRVFEVKQSAYNRRIALRNRPGEHRLVLQTSEGPPGTIPKLQVAARLVGAGWTDEPAPKARPRACWQPRAAAGGSQGGNRNRPNATEAPAAAGAATGGGPTDAVALAVGGGAVLLGSTLFAIYLVRRPPGGQRRPPAGQGPAPATQRPPPWGQRRRP
jgi:hypothetical protein